MIIKNHFHKKGFALGLVLKQRLAASRKRPITFSSSYGKQNNLKAFSNLKDKNTHRSHLVYKGDCSCGDFKFTVIEGRDFLDCN